MAAWSTVDLSTSSGASPTEKVRFAHPDGRALPLEAVKPIVRELQEVADLALGALLHELRQRLLHVRERHLALAGEWL